MDDLVDQIEEIRVRSNGLWMALLRLAIEANPGGAKTILREIQANDTAVTRLLRELADSL